MLFPYLHGLLPILKFLHNVVVLCFQATILLVDHGNSLVFVYVVMGHGAALQLGIMVRQGLVLFQQLLIAVLPHSAGLLVDCIVFYLLVLLDILLDLL